MTYLPAPVPGWPDFRRASVIEVIRASRALPPASSDAERTAIRDQWAQATGAPISAANPVMVWRSDLDRIEISENGSTWDPLTPTRDYAPALGTGWTVNSGSPKKIRVAGGVATYSATLLWGAGGHRSNLFTIPAAISPGSGTIPVGTFVNGNSVTGAATMGTLFSANGIVGITGLNYITKSLATFPTTVHCTWQVR